MGKCCTGRKYAGSGSQIFFEWLEGAEDKALQPVMGVASGNKDDGQLSASTERDKTVRFELTFKGTLDQFRATVHAVGILGDIPTESQLRFSNTVSLDDDSAFFPHLATFSFCLLLDHNRCIDQSHDDDEKNVFVYFRPKYGHLIVQSLPDNKSRLVVEVGEEVWPMFVQPWRLFQAELARQGWVDAQPTEGAALGDGQQGEQTTALLQRIYDHFVKHGEWPRYYDLEIEMHDVAPLYEIISGIDEGLLLYEWPIRESEYLFSYPQGNREVRWIRKGHSEFSESNGLVCKTVYQGSSNCHHQ